MSGMDAEATQASERSLACFDEVSFLVLEFLQD